jgi:DNA invertase Pin-like site-specific DNA recombinase
MEFSVNFKQNKVTMPIRFARNTRDLLEPVEQLAAKGLEFVSQKEHIDTTTPDESQAHNAQGSAPL